MSSSDPAAVLVGMPEFVVRAAVEDDGEVWMLVETPASGGGLRRLRPPGGVQGPAADQGARPRGRGTAGGAGVGQAPVALPRSRLRRRHLDRAGQLHRPPGGADRAGPRRGLPPHRRGGTLGGRGGPGLRYRLGHGVGAFVFFARPAVDDPARIGGVVALGIDETGFLAATPTHPRIFATGLVDVRRGLLCDVIEGRSASNLRLWLAARPMEWLREVEVVSIDPHEAYRLGLWPDLAQSRGGGPFSHRAPGQPGPR